MGRHGQVRLPNGSTSSARYELRAHRVSQIFFSILILLIVKLSQQVVMLFPVQLWGQASWPFASPFPESGACNTNSLAPLSHVLMHLVLSLSPTTAGKFTMDKRKKKKSWRPSNYLKGSKYTHALSTHDNAWVSETTRTPILAHKIF